MQVANTFYFKDDGIIPNSSLPVILYKSVINLPDSSEWLEAQFIKNNWMN